MDLDALSQLLRDVALGTEPDRRTYYFKDSNHRLVSGLIYWASVPGDHTCAAYTFVWKSFAPRVKFFGWLLTKERIHCRTNLERKNIIDDATCGFCKLTDETVDHIFSGCPFVQSCWASIGWAPQHIASCKTIWLSSPLPMSPTGSCILCCCSSVGRFGSTATTSSSTRFLQASPG